MNTLLHFDTLDSTSTYNYDDLYSDINAYTTTNQDAVLNGGTTYTAGNPYNCNFMLRNAIYDVKSVRLSSLEMPILFYNIRSDNGSNQLTFKAVSTTITITITEKNYTDISVLLTEINTKILASYATYSILFKLDSITGKVYIQSTIPTTNNLTITPGILSKMLGKAESGDNYVVTAGTGYSYFSNAYNLNNDNYISMVINNLNLNTSSASGKPITWKIPINASHGDILFLSDSSTLRQKIEIYDRNFTLGNLNIVIYDRWGYRITNSNGGDYSFTLSIEHNCQRC